MPLPDLLLPHPFPMGSICRWDLPASRTLVLVAGDDTLVPTDGVTGSLAKWAEKAGVLGEIEFLVASSRADVGGERFHHPGTASPL